MDKKSLTVTVHTECGNCGATLMGPYCFKCGQHAHESARSFSALFHDAWHTATHLDGRLWQSLYILLLKPGRLTKEYFAERRARYLPPVRLYLVLSVLFFGFGLATPERNPAAPRVASRVAPAATAAAGQEQSTSQQAPAVKKKKSTRIFDIKDCSDLKSSMSWLEKILQRSCLRNQEDGGESIEHAFLANVPKMIFLLVPMMALVMLLLYWRPRRYYVEHLVFYLHNHAAIFLLLLIQALLAWIAAWLAWGTFFGWVTAFISIYSAWYVYRAMRVFYGQGRLLTTAKLLAIGVTYLVGFVFTMAATAIVSVLVA